MARKTSEAPAVRCVDGLRRFSVDLARRVLFFLEPLTAEDIVETYHVEPFTVLSAHCRGLTEHATIFAQGDSPGITIAFPSVSGNGPALTGLEIALSARVLPMETHAVIPIVATRFLLLLSAMCVLAAMSWQGLAPVSAASPKLDVEVLRVPNGGIQPQALLDSRGVVHLLYYSGDPAHGDLHYVNSADEGRSWTQPLRVNSQAGSAIALGTIRGGQMALGRNGRVYVAWNGSSVTEGQGLMNPEAGKRGMPMLYTRLNDAHTGFESQRNLMTRTFGLDGGGTVAADRAGRVYVAWHGKGAGAAAGEAGRQVWITTSTDDGKTFMNERPAAKDATGACGCCGMALFSDSKGDVYGLYRSATEEVHRDIYLLSSEDHGANFSDRKLHPWAINACPMSSMEFAEGAGRVEAAWETGGQVYFANVDNAGSQPISAPLPDHGHKHPRLAINSSGETLLAWADGTGWGRGGSIEWQMYDQAGAPVSPKGSASGLPAWSFPAVIATRDRFLIIY